MIRLAIAAFCVATTTASAAERPAILFNRWQEDWSALADPDVPREALDSLKYIPLADGDPKTYLSFGADLRERFESDDAVNFGVGGTRPQSYVISRLEAHADLRIADQLQAFVQLQSDFAPGKTIITPVDRDRLDLEQAFVSLTEPLGDGTLKLRVGRQQIGFDLQRFISVRDGPNVRQSYDALWADYETGPWRFTSFYSQPVQNRDGAAFDDYSSGHLTYGGVRVERKLGDLGNLSATLSQFKQDNAHFPSVTGNERRNVLDIRYAGATSGIDWDIETMGQAGRMASDKIRAWAFGSRAGYTLGDLAWSPRLGLQLDAASGDRKPHDGTLETFNPLFPNGYYVTLSGFTGYTNFVHLKPSVTLHPQRSLTVLLAFAAQWREATGDAVYTQPDIAVPGSAGHGGGFTGTYWQARLDWQLTPHVTGAVEAVRFNIADAIRSLGGHDANYLGVELKYGW
jgi:alginate export protein